MWCVLGKENVLLMYMDVLEVFVFDVNGLGGK